MSEVPSNIIVSEEDQHLTKELPRRFTVNLRKKGGSFIQKSEDFLKSGKKPDMDIQWPTCNIADLKSLMGTA